MRRTAPRPPGQDQQAMRPVRSSEVDHRARQRAGDALDALNLGEHEFAEVIKSRRARADDDVVRTGDILSVRNTVERGNFPGHLGGLPDLGLNEDVRLHHKTPLSLMITDGYGRHDHAARGRYSSAG